MGLRTELEDPHSPLNQAAASYQAQLGPDAVSPPIPTMLKERADALEERFDAPIAEMQGMLKDIAEDLVLEDYVSPFYLKQQRLKTDYYSRHPNLVHIKQERGGTECFHG